MTEPAEPQYPQAPPPAYPQAPPPTYPQAPPPTYPQAPPPAYPQTPPSAQAPPPPQAPPYPQAAAPQPPALPPAPPPPPPAPHPHELRFAQRRVHIAEHQRGADGTAVSGLLLHVPNFLCSLLVVSLLSVFFGLLGIVIVVAWLASGALVFHRPTERFIARRLLKLRHPTPQELARITPVWQEVLARAGIEAHTYELWVEDSDRLNAVAAAGHIVGVTRFSIERLPSGQLAAVLAHELGHHVGGHTWSSLLGYWYALPGRIAWRLMLLTTYVAIRVSGLFSWAGPALVMLVFGMVAVVTISFLYGLPLLVLITPYLLAAVGRRAEFHADQQAAALGFAPMLAEVLGLLHAAEQQAEALAAARGRPVKREGALARLLHSHPDYPARLRRLQPHAGPPTPA
ncbi:M48 family metalloprotease [Streptomyces luomodiensis]|uniref:M48 family metalloprotease n=1 Tax=Streptomyces luomodiensis TaxID=3026192 RepID=A0ABY9V828_9ACTN|nr:M48 family metalloprotease [Streptomyces sp. SCA4-21]WNE98154.1 M48 family metalloprotease [Streptomyces sp. SCA4-21]